MRDALLRGWVVNGVVLFASLGMLACGGASATNHSGSAAGGAAGRGVPSAGDAGDAGGAGGSGGLPSNKGARFQWIEPVPAHVQAAATTSARTLLRSSVSMATADGSVVVGESTLWVYRTDDDFTEHSEHFRWTERTGSVSLGALPGIDTTAAQGLVTEVVGMSADGSVLFGITVGAGGSRVAFRWTSAEGMVELHPPSTTTIASIVGVSADGSALAGTLLASQGQRAFRWTAQAGMFVLEPVPGDTSSEAVWMSADGSVVAGTSSHGGGEGQAFRWTAGGGVVGLGLLPTTTTCGLLTLPANVDGSVLYGLCGSNAFRWTASSGIVSLGSLPGYERLVPFGMSTDGNAISGVAVNGGNDSQVFYWSADGGLLGLGFLPGDAQSGIRPFRAMSDDGSVVVGYGDSGAFRWTKTSGMQRLAPLPGEDQTSAITLSADGSVTAGDSGQHHEPGTDATAGPDAVYWRVPGSPISVAASLEAAAVDLSGAQLKSCWVSSDGSAFVGLGANASGGLRGFIAHVPL